MLILQLQTFIENIMRHRNGDIGKDSLHGIEIVGFLCELLDRFADLITALAPSMHGDWVKMGYESLNSLFLDPDSTLLDQSIHSSFWSGSPFGDFHFELFFRLRLLAIVNGNPEALYFFLELIG